jgi:hypothetical protein
MENMSYMPYTHDWIGGEYEGIRIKQAELSDREGFIRRILDEQDRRKAAENLANQRSRDLCAMIESRDAAVKEATTLKAKIAELEAKLAGAEALAKPMVETREIVCATASWEAIKASIETNQDRGRQMARAIGKASNRMGLPHGERY